MWGPSSLTVPAASTGSIAVASVPASLLSLSLSNHFQREPSREPILRDFHCRLTLPFSPYVSPQDKEVTQPLLAALGVHLGLAQ